MEFSPTKLAGAFVVTMKPIEDERGYFGRGWCRDEFTQHGLNPNMTQLNVGFSHRKGTVRGMHYQLEPHQEAKLVRCTRGAIYDVIIDLRPGSPTRGQWVGVQLTGRNGLMLYAPEGFAHGYQTLADDVEIYYLTSSAYAPGSACGLRFDDPAIAIRWPEPVTVVSQADRSWPDYGV
ncbi:MAG: dTDP-4-dehydrorhamnose 3,5-epimerase [Vicinamibacterales bacterium]